MSDASRVYSACDVGAPEAVALRTAGPAAVRASLLAARERTLVLADDYEHALGSRGLRVDYDPGLNPPTWEWGHVAWFQEWWIARNRERMRGVRADPDCERLPSLLAHADSWYDSSRVAHHTRWELPLPDADATRDYLARTLASTLEALDGLPHDAGDDALYFFRLVALHEEMHAEAACYMARTLGIDVREREAPTIAESAELALDAQRWRLGSPARGFAFDNELAAHEVDVERAHIDAQPVTWSRFLPFVQAGGYDEPQWWSEAGRAWLATQPLHLRRGPEGWQQLRGGGWHAIDPRQAVIHVSAHEAQAWCAWAGRRLPTEAQWECAALTLPGFQWGHAWEWTASDFLPFPGFEPHPYRDYSAPWFGTRRALRGACAATSPSLAHARYRNFFEPHRRDVFAGFRSCA